MSDTTALAALAFGPHPDDVELCCGGLLATLAARGHRVGIVDLTRGELASNGTPEGRAAEAQAAARILGVAHRENLGLPDGGLDPSAGYGAPPADGPRALHLAPVVEAIRRLRPELVLAPHPHARHPDHVATSELVTRAVFFAGVRRFATEPPSAPFTPRRLAYYMMRGAFEPSFVADVSDAHDAKMAAIACYGSQVSRDGGAAPTLANAPLNVSALEARDRYYGAMIGVRHGEPFRLRAPLGLRDPVAAFRDEPGVALFYPAEP